MTTMTTLTSFTLSGSIGVDAAPVEIRCAIDASRPDGFVVKGVSPTRAKEISARVRSAIHSTSLCPWPKGQVTVEIDAKGAKLLSMAGLDLAIVCAIAGVDASGLIVAGEVGFEGSVRGVRGVVQAAQLAKTLGLRGLVIPAHNAEDALAFAGALEVYALTGLREVLDLAAVPFARSQVRRAPKPAPDFSEVRGQGAAVEAVARAAVSGRNMLLSGSPGTGKTMIARRITGLLPQMTHEESLEVTRVYSAVGMSDGLLRDRPFRAPHHTISSAALSGGGNTPRPGEAQLAARGVLFLDEVTEFHGAAIEALVYALQAMPAASRPLVVASALPCPCGWYNRSEGPAVRVCTCSAAARERHDARVAKIVDKLDLAVTVEIQSPTLQDLRAMPTGETSASLAARVAPGA